jgi:hypothetical protein
VSVVVLERLTQLGPPTVEQYALVRLAEAQQIAHLVAVHSVHVAEADHYALPLRQLRKGRGEADPDLTGDGVVLRRRFPRGRGGTG